MIVGKMCRKLFADKKEAANINDETCLQDVLDVLKILDSLQILKH